MAILPNLIYRFIAIPFKTIAGFFAETGQMTLKCVWNDKSPGIAKILKQKSRTYTSQFQNYYKVITIKKCGSNKRRNTKDQWKRTENPEKRKKKKTLTFMASWFLAEMPR